MNHAEWMDAWLRIKDRFPSWQPTQTESEDWCMALRYYEVGIVEAVGQWVTQTYSSKEPKLAWYVRECEKRKRAKQQQVSEMAQPNSEEQREEFERSKEESIARLEAIPIDDLREACKVVLERWGHFVSPPPSKDVREWKATLRSLVYVQLFGGDS